MWPVGVRGGVDLVGVHRQCDEELMGARHPAEVLAGPAGGRAECTEAPMVTVEADPVRVESRLAGRGDRLPGLPGVCWARGVMPGLRGVAGSADPVRPRRARCRACLVTHVLLPVTVLLRRAYAAGTDLGRAAGPGRRVGAPPDRGCGWGAGGHGAGLAAAGWPIGWRRSGRGSSRSRCRAGVDVAIPDAFGCPWQRRAGGGRRRDRGDHGRFGPAGLLGAVTAWQVAVAASGGRLLAPGWPPAAGGGLQHELPLTRRGGDR